MMYIAKIFKNGHSQAVRLPREFRLNCKEAIVTHLGNSIVLQPVKNSWLDIYYSMKELTDFMNEREDLPPQEREPI